MKTSLLQNRRLLWASLALGLVCALALVFFIVRGPADRYMMGEARLESTRPGDPALLKTVSVRISSDGTVEIKYGALVGADVGTGSFVDNNFTATVSVAFEGPVTFQGTSLTETDESGQTLTGISGKVTQQNGYSGEFTVVELPDVKKTHEIR